jgi:hypothetical protein
MKELMKLLVGIFNPADNGEGEARVNQVAKVLGTVVIVLGALASAANELLAILQGGG